MAEVEAERGVRTAEGRGVLVEVRRLTAGLIIKRLDTVPAQGRQNLIF